MNPKYILLGLSAGWAIGPAFGLQQEQGLAILRLLVIVGVIIISFYDDHFSEK